jgi:hypothetical protein
MLPLESSRISYPFSSSTAGEKHIPVSYDPGILGNPEGMVAGFAHSLAHHLAGTVQESPPGGTDN